MITLVRGKFELDIAPEIGGSVTRFVCNDRPVLRPVPQGTANVLDTCMFPLVPYANRIAGGRFEFGGKAYRLPLNFGEHPHSLHGHGWQNSWRVEILSRDRVSLAYDHAPDAWDWAYSSEQVFAMTEDGFEMTLSLRSRDDKPMPYSLGLHPYFPRCPGSKITAAVAGMWCADDTMLPTEHVAAGKLIDLNSGQVVSAAPFVDSTFTGWKGTAVIAQPDLGFEVLLSSDTKFFHVFIPEGDNFFCAEPTTAMPNAFNRPEPPQVSGAQVLAPGATASVALKLAIRTL
jgi:aldose 1-epimerase